MPEYRKLSHNKDSIYVNLPSKIVRCLDLNISDMVKVVQSGKRIIIEKVKE